METQPPPQKGVGAPSPIFVPCLRPNGCIDQNTTWYGGRPQPRGLCVRWGPFPSQKRVEPSSPIFRPCLLWPNDWMDQNGTWCGGCGPWSGPHCARWGPSSPPKEGGRASPNFRPIFGRPFVKRFALCYQTVVCPVLSCLSVTFVHCGQTVGRIEKKLGVQVGLGPGHIVLDGDPAPPPPKGHSPPIFGPYLLQPNGCMDQDVTWYGTRPRPRRLCIRWRPRSPSQKGGSPQFPAYVYCGQTAG